MAEEGWDSVSVVEGEKGDLAPGDTNPGDFWGCLGVLEIPRGSSRDEVHGGGDVDRSRYVVVLLMWETKAETNY